MQPHILTEHKVRPKIEAEVVLVYGVISFTISSFILSYIPSISFNISVGAPTSSKDFQFRGL